MYSHGYEQDGQGICLGPFAGFPRWVPVQAVHYILHIETGSSIRGLAKTAGCHASTILRQVQKMEKRRDDPLIDGALEQLTSAAHCPNNPQKHIEKDAPFMTQQIRFSKTSPDDETLEREGRRILRRLCEPGACLAVAADLEKAVVVRDVQEGRTVRTAVVDRPVAQAMALKDWISCAVPGRISRYQITNSGRVALKALLAKHDGARNGFSEGAVHFDTGRPVGPANAETQGRYSYSESPISAMARRKDKGGNPFLSAELVSVAERLREDFEVAQMGPKPAQNWEQYLGDGPEPGTIAEAVVSDASDGARQRVSKALRALGPGLGDVVLRVCCYLEGLEAAEKRMGWSARSGKVVLRIALQRLKQHYDRSGNSGMIG